ncbi:RHS repeat domain-containing protein [Flavobacterium sp.]|jgi:YD repeat-containing protein|uniref:RHS repeat domain-containing protein n=1 Tax=Flavobacterium sp. TaxID=239 RepID=UPI0037BF16F5
MSRTLGSKSRGKAALWVVGLAAPVAGLQAGVTNYTYDELGRLVRVSDTRNGDRVYAYDPAGNRTQMVVGAPRVGEVLEAAPADPSEKVYSASTANPDSRSPIEEPGEPSSENHTPSTLPSSADPAQRNTERR